MDRVELGIKFEQINKLMDAGDYVGASKVCDDIEWRKVKKWTELSIAEEAYEKARRFKEARNICVYAYNRNLGGKRIVAKLTELSIIIEDFDEAEELYHEFVEIAPTDNERFVLLYKLNRAKKADVTKLIQILEEYKRNELEEEYEYELAKLYAQAGRVEDCVKECDELILWFNEGNFVEKALRLKANYTTLTKSQQAKLNLMEECKKVGTEYTLIPEESDFDDVKVEDMEVPVKDYTLYDTQNIQEELAKEMAAILAENDSQSESKQAEAQIDLENSMSEAHEPGRDFSIYDTQNIQEDLARSMADAIATANTTPEEDTTEGPLESPSLGEKPSTYSIYDTQNIQEDLAKNMAAILAAAKTQPPVEVTPNIDPDLLKASEADVVYNQIIKSYEEENVEPATEEPEEISISDAVMEASVPVPADIDVIDEPTKEIDLKSVQWKRVVSVMEETAEEAKAEAKANTAELPVAEIAAAAAPASVGPATPAGEAANPEDEVLEGQIDLMSWLSSEDANTPEVTETKEDKQEAVEIPVQTEVIDEATEIPAQTEAIEEATETPASEEANQEAEVEDAINEMAQKLMEEVARDLAEEEAKKREDSIPMVEEEEFISDSDEEDSAENDEFREDFDDFDEDEEEEDKEEAFDDFEEAPARFSLRSVEKKYLKKYLFINGLEEKVARILESKRSESSDGTSATGNIAVIGTSKTDKTGFAINLFKALNADQAEDTLRIAKTNAGIINRKGIKASAAKIKGATLIIEGAGQLSKAALDELVEVMSGDTGSMLVIFTGDEFTINKMFMENAKLSSMFPYRVEIRHYTANELVALAKEYARVKGYQIADNAMVSVYTIVGGIEGNDAGNEMELVKEMIDKAIEKHNKKSFFSFGKKEGKLIMLKDKDFRF